METKLALLTDIIGGCPCSNNRRFNIAESIIDNKMIAQCILCGKEYLIHKSDFSYVKK